MSFKPITILEPRILSPLVVDSPHSGRNYVEDFRFSCPFPLLRQTEDFLVDELVTGAVESGATVIAAQFPRSYIDANRAENDIDAAILADAWPEPLQPSARTPLGLGLVRRLCMTGVPVYAAPLGAEEIRQRIETCYRPYHAALATALDQRAHIFGAAWLIDAHSMPGRGPDDGTAARADFVLGDRQGESCDPSFTRMAAGLLHDMGYSVALNEPYKGMEIVRRHGQPAKGRHALQLEINRRLYMDERKLEKNHGFDKLRHDMTQFFAQMSTELMRLTAAPLAAE